MIIAISLIISLGLAADVASANVSSPSSAVASDPDRPSWSSSSAQVARPRLEESEQPALLAPIFTGIATALGGVAGYTLGTWYGGSSPVPSQSCVMTGCGGLLIGTAAGAAVGTGVAVIVDHDIDPLAIAAAGIGAPAGAIMTWGALAYLMFPLAYGRPLVPATDEQIFNILSVVAVVGGVGMGTAVAVGTVTTMRYREPGAPFLAAPPDLRPTILPAIDVAATTDDEPASPPLPSLVDDPAD